MTRKETNNPATKQRYNKTYAKKLNKEKLVRILIYVKKTTLPSFENQIYQRSQEYIDVHSQRSREKLAKIDWFEDSVQNKNHVYWIQQEEIEQLRRENTALAPAFLHDKNLDHVPLPLSIQQLDDDPTVLKRLLTISDRERKRATQLLNDYEDQAKRARLAQNIAEKRVELLEQRLIEHNLSPEVEVLV